MAKGLKERMHASLFLVWDMLACTTDKLNRRCSPEDFVTRQAASRAREMFSAGSLKGHCHA